MKSEYSTMADRRIIWLLLHHHDDPDLPLGGDDKVLGYFTSQHLAQQARDDAMPLPGFSQFPDGFEIVQLQLGKLLGAPGVEIR